MLYVSKGYLFVGIVKNSQAFSIIAVRCQQIEKLLVVQLHVRDANGVLLAALKRKGYIHAFPSLRLLLQLNKLFYK